MCVCACVCVCVRKKKRGEKVRNSFGPKKRKSRFFIALLFFLGCALFSAASECNGRLLSLCGGMCTAQQPTEGAQKSGEREERGAGERKRKDAVATDAWQWRCVP